MKALEALRDAGVPHYFVYISALDRYYRTGYSPNVYVYTPASLVDIAKILPNLRYPHLDRWDIAVEEGGTTLYISCGDSEAPESAASYTVFGIYYDPVNDTFFDPNDAYADLRLPTAESTRKAAPLATIIEGAVLLARYQFSTVNTDLSEPPRRKEMLPEEQRMILTDILTGASPGDGLQFLLDEGFIDAYWPDLATMDTVDHTKDHHPEGNVWTHSLETMKYRKTSDLTLTLGLLFHDIGKPMAIPTRDRVFDKHANIGANIARKFLRSLSFEESVVEDVGWLVWNHMFPGALHRLPVNRTESLMSSELFPILLELYRCDLSSSYRGPEGYYRACKIYRSFLKNRSNPFRDNEGKKLMKLYVE